MTPPAPLPASVPPRPRKKRNILWKAVLLSRASRRWKWGLRLAIAIPLLLIAATIVLTHSPLTKMLILPRVAAASGLNVKANWVHIQASGTVVMDKVELTIPGVPGEAGRFLRIARLEADMDWWNTVTGSPTVGRVRMTDPVLVVSQSPEDGSLNVGSIRPPGGAGTRMQLPGISATNVGLELGEHKHGVYTPLKRIQMDGSFTPNPGEPGNYTLTLYETFRRTRPGLSSAGGFTLGGTVSDGKIDLKLLNFSLSDWPASTQPSAIRDIFEDLDLIGDVPSARFTYTREGGIVASMDLKGVAMNLPLEASVQGPVYQEPNADGTVPPPPPVKYMRMSNVDGTITFARDSVTARVGGLIEDLPYEVTLRYDGVDENSPFHLDFVSKDFHMSRNPELLLYAPPVVKYYLKTFLMPTGMVTSRVTVTRGPPVRSGGTRKPGDIAVSGSIDFAEGTAAYEAFPYEFSQLHGRFEFDNNEIRIVSVNGTSATGAKLQAHGSIGPLDETSEVDINVVVTDAQIDEAMEAAFGAGRSAVITALFNETRHQQLVDAGLIRTPQQAAAETRELAALEAAPEPDIQRIEALRQRQAVPVFAFRGVADVTIHVFSPRGVDAPYSTNVDVFLPQAGLVPDKFPLPLVAENVSVEVRGKKGRLAFGTFRAASGGRADVSATFEVPVKAGDDDLAPPEIRISAWEVPVGPLLINAIPGDESGGGKSSRIKKILRDLNVGALASGKVRIAAREAPKGTVRATDDLGFDADMNITSGEVIPRPEGGIAVAGLSGRLQVSETELWLDLDGIPVTYEPQQAQDVGPPLPLKDHPRSGGTLTLHTHGLFPPEGSGKEPHFYVHASCPTFDVASPFECLVNVFSPEAAAAIERGRAEYRPSGHVNVRAEAESVPTQDAPKLRVDLTHAMGLGADVLGGRAELHETAGSVAILAGGGAPSLAQFDALSGTLVFANERAGIVSIDGTLPIGDPAPEGLSVEVALLDGRFESALTRTILEQMDAPPAADADPNSATALYSRLKPSGRFDAALVVRPRSDGRPLFVQGRIEPRSLTLSPDEAPVTFTEVGGVVEFEPGSGILRDFNLISPEWSVHADGAWTIRAGRDLTFRSSISARGNKLSDDLKAVLPVELRSLFDDLKITVSGPFQLSDAALDIARAEKSATQFNGRFDFTDASIEAGVGITDLSGSLLVNFDSAGAAPRFTLDARADHFDISGVTLTNGFARIRNGSLPGQVLIPEASGMCHGGRFHVRAEVGPDGPEPASPRRFNANFQVAGVRFSPLLKEIVESVKPMVGPPSPEEMARTDLRNEFSRGVLDAEVTLDGLVADPESRRGRGNLRISGGRVLNLPFMTGLVEATNLALPVNSSLDYAWASVFIEGGLIRIDELSIQSRSIEFTGGGTMTWPERDLNLRLQSRSTRPIPLLSDLVQGIRHRLIIARVTGKLGEQEFSLETPGAPRMLDGAWGEGADVRPGSDRRTEADRERDRRRNRGIRPVPASSGAASSPDGLAAEREDRSGP